MRLQLDDALLQLTDPEPELLDKLTECAILGLAGGSASGQPELSRRTGP